MSGAFSKRLLDSYQARAKGSHTPHSTYQRDSISMQESAPFNSTMHGTYHPQDAFSCTANDSPFLNLSADTEMKLAALQAKLNQKLGPEFISTRPGGNGMKLTYTEGWKVINLANEVFGFNGWSTTVVNVTCDFADYDPNTQRHTVGIAAIVRVTLRDGVYHEDTGYGVMENSKSKGAAFDKVCVTHVYLRSQVSFLRAYPRFGSDLPVSKRGRHRCPETCIA
jgi:DNA repair and recombination protein RAD52